MSSLGHNLRVLFYGKATFHSRYILFYIISNISIPSAWKVMTSWWVLVHFWICLLNRLFRDKLGQPMDMVMTNLNRKNFAWFGGLGLKCRSSTNAPQLINNQLWRRGFLLFWTYTVSEQISCWCYLYRKNGNSNS